MSDDETVKVRFFAAAREAAGCAFEDLPAGPVVTLTAQLVTRHGDRMGRVLGASTVLVDGQRVATDSDRHLPAGSVVDVLPPFAGG